MNDHYYTFTIGLSNTVELYQFDSTKSKFIGTAKPEISLFLTRPLVAHNPLSEATAGTRFTGLIIRQYDTAGTLMKAVEYKDVTVTRLDQGPDLILEFTYRV
jgi:hypothetical protein